MNAVQTLRAATAADHESVDAAFGEVDFSDRAAYGRFLLAHARALPAVERALADFSALPAQRPRTPLIESDLAALGLDIPAPLRFSPGSTPAAGFGAAYVIEGSRLGGGMLARRVGEGLPTAYLADTHQSGEWRGFLGALDQAADGDAWIAEAVTAARATFDLYRRAAVAL
ncbi:biliverdin-producing heme oxygenase [Sphingomonas sp. BIUV-7]|uniref:Biliverdin-producing heme oxygenase n=1 Tax=Sphingomonas natans TaxID=3063330 RepID=A0ABT8Y607_9SPHN|nr:biliverdin-producing heme oxygenase [Sphingomonas sp. BIUV-7]MDO6413754.1 biliverdin-producing heme oxygenase [Sphingomonas sp. BIUV-7]